MYKVNNKPLPLDRAFTLGGIQYPSNWLRLASEADKAACGITWQAEATRADDRFYWSGDITNPKALEDRLEVDEDGNPMYVKVLDNSDPENPVMVDSTERLVHKGLKSQWVAQVKGIEGNLLAQTDWMVIRKAERKIAISSEVIAFRAGIVAEGLRLKSAIYACADVKELIEIINSQNWEITKPKSLSEAKTDAARMIDEHHEMLISNLVGNPTQAEQHTWGVKLDTATAVTAGAEPSVAGKEFLKSANIITTEEQSAWAKVVLYKAGLYAHVVGVGERLRSDARKKIHEAETVEQVSLLMDESIKLAQEAVQNCFSK
jgi:hypothetical protein